MSITKTSTFLKMEIRSNKDVVITTKEVFDDPNDDQLPVETTKESYYIPSSDLSSLPDEIQSILVHIWETLPDNA